jgi:hypothetical protein
MLYNAINGMAGHWPGSKKENSALDTEQMLYNAENQEDKQ